jgi:hypothetical protein
MDSDILNNTRAPGNTETTDLGLHLIANNKKINDLKTDVDDSRDLGDEDDIDDILESDPDQENSVASTISNMSIKESRRSAPAAVEESYEDKLRKIELLRIFADQKAQGFRLSREYTINSNLADLEMEFQLLKMSKQKKNALKLSQGFLINAVQALEFLNTTYDPIGMDLVGFSEIVSLGVEDYDDVLEELYEKYKNYGRKIEPEIKLVLMISASATSFHASKQLLNKIPGMENQLKKNPKIINKLGKSLVTEEERKSDDNMEFVKRANMNSSLFRNKINKSKIKKDEGTDETVMQLDV